MLGLPSSILVFSSTTGEAGVSWKRNILSSPSGVFPKIRKDRFLGSITLAGQQKKY